MRQPLNEYRAPVPFDDEQTAVLSAVLHLEHHLPPAEFGSLWEYAMKRDFRMEPEADGRLRRALGPRVDFAKSEVSP